MTAGVEKEELRHNESFDEHDYASGHDGQETDNVHDAQDIEDYVAWAGQRFVREGHFFWIGIGVLS